MNLLPIFIPSYNRPEVQHTVQWLEDSGIENYKVCLHNKQQEQEYLRAGKVKPEKILVTGAQPGIANQRIAIQKEFAPQYKWYVMMDDNIRGMNRVIDRWYHSYDQIDVTLPLVKQKDFDQETTAKKFMELANLDLQKADKLDIDLLGFATVGNYFFNATKYRYVGYVIAKAILIRGGIDTYFDTNLQAMDDYGFTAENLKRKGKVLINNWIKPQAKHYEPGGIGQYDDRVCKKIADTKYLMKKYPGLFRYKFKKGKHPMAELQLKYTNVGQIDMWRRNLETKNKVPA